MCSSSYYGQHSGNAAFARYRVNPLPGSSLEARAERVLCLLASVWVSPGARDEASAALAEEEARSELFANRHDIESVSGRSKTPSEQRGDSERGAEKVRRIPWQHTADVFTNLERGIRTGHALHARSFQNKLCYDNKCFKVHRYIFR